MPALLDTPRKPVLRAAAAKLGRIPPLMNGDRMDAAEFLRRYEAAGEGVLAELINEEVIMLMATHGEGHGLPDSIANFWLGYFAVKTPWVEHYNNTTTRLSRTDVPQPDGLLVIKAEHGGQTHLSEDDFLEGAPELVLEVSASSASYDLHKKLRAYEQAGVREYVVVRTWDGEVDWFILREGKFVKQAEDEDGVLRSELFPGLWLDANALLELDRAGVLTMLERGLAERDASTAA